jgi:transcriptional adapter 3
MSSASSSASGMTMFEKLPPLRSAILKKIPETVPPTDELESLQAELQLLKQRTLERARKASEDMKMIEESMRRIKEKEKGKAKAVDRIKKERGCTSL